MFPVSTKGENLLLCQQPNVLGRKVRQRVELTNPDRLLCVWLGITDPRGSVASDAETAQAAMAKEHRRHLFGEAAKRMDHYRQALA